MRQVLKQILSVRGYLICLTIGLSFFVVDSVAHAYVDCGLRLANPDPETGETTTVAIACEPPGYTPSRVVSKLRMAKNGDVYGIALNTGQSPECKTSMKVQIGPPSGGPANPQRQPLSIFSAACNRAPTIWAPNEAGYSIPSQTLAKDQAIVQYQINFEDRSTDLDEINTGTFEIEGAPASGVYLTGSGSGLLVTRTLNINPALIPVGTYNMTVHVKDINAFPATGSSNQFTVTNTPDCLPPVFANIPDQSVDENTNIDVPLTITYQGCGAPSNNDLHATPNYGFIFAESSSGVNTMKIMPANFGKPPGTYPNVRMCAINLQGEQGCSNLFTVTVTTTTPPTCAAAPTISNVADQTVEAGTMIVVPITVTPAYNCSVDSVSFNQNQPLFTHIVQEGATGWTMHIEPPASNPAQTYPNIKLQATSSSFTGYSNLFSIQVTAPPPPGRVKRYTSGMNLIATYDTIQAAIDAAANTNIVIPDVGLYNESINFIGKNIVVKSTDPSNANIVDTTIIRASGSNATVTIDSPCTGTLDGFTITGGTNSGIFIKNSTPTIKRNDITGNTVNNSFGGGIGIDGASPIILNNTITSNTSTDGTGPPSQNLHEDGRGGGIGIYHNASSPTIQNNIISLNTAKAGGGIAIDANASGGTIGPNTITSNTAGIGGGGGIWLCGRATITGSTITNNTSGTGGGVAISDSGTVYNACGQPATLTGNTISNNTATSTSGIGIGAGIYVGAAATIDIEWNTIANNNAQSHGGGFYSDNAIGYVPGTPKKLSNNVISSNTAHFGGGINFGGIVDLQIQSNVITNNTAFGNNSLGAGSGGGIYQISLGYTTISNNTIIGNTAQNKPGASADWEYGYGGGITTTGALDGVWRGGGLIKNNTIARNTAEGGGAGIEVGSTALAVDIVNNTIVSNTASAKAGGGIRIDQSEPPTANDNITVDSNIVRGNTAVGSAQIFVNIPAPANFLVKYTDIQGGWSGSGSNNIDADPLFVNAALNDYHLQAASPCKDTGNPALGAGTDMGAFPYP